MQKRYFVCKKCSLASWLRFWPVFALGPTRKHCFLTVFSLRLEGPFGLPEGPLPPHTLVFTQNPTIFVIIVESKEAASWDSPLPEMARRLDAGRGQVRAKVPSFAPRLRAKVQKSAGFCATFARQSAERKVRHLLERNGTKFGC